MEPEKALIEACKEAILKKLGWQQKEEVMQRDFEYVSQLIFESTRVQLSVATLRRIWSNQYHSLPQVKTLDALAQFTGFASWHEFSQHHHGRKEKKNPSKRKLAVPVLLTVATLLLSAAFITLVPRQPHLDPGAVSLEPRDVSQHGVPATVGFDYDISKIRNKDVYIELSWNPYERTRLAPDHHFYTGVYFLPDYHWSKLIADDSVLVKKPVYVTTADWHGALMDDVYDTSPVYINRKDYRTDNKMSMSAELIEMYNLKPADIFYPVFTLSNPVLEQVDADNFTLTASINTLPDRTPVLCKNLHLILKAEHGAVSIPVSDTGCYGETNLMFSDVRMRGKLNDLSALSADLRVPQQLTVNVKEKEVTITLGDNEPLKFSYKSELGKLKVIKFFFKGFAEVRNISLKTTDGKAVLHTDLALP